MQLELKAIQQRTETTFVYVTHDQEEALTMSDRIAVMCDGRVEQIASPREMYERPANRFVAEFIGVSNMVTITPTRTAAGIASADLGGDSHVYVADPGDGRATIELTIRPEKIKLDPGPGGERDCRIRGRLLESVYLGSMTQVIVAAETGDRLVVHVLNDTDTPSGLVPGTEVTLGWAAEHSYVLGTGPGTDPPVETAPAEAGA